MTDEENLSPEEPVVSDPVAEVVPNPEAEVEVAPTPEAVPSEAAPETVEPEPVPVEPESALEVVRESPEPILELPPIPEPIASEPTALEGEAVSPPQPVSEPPQRSPKTRKASAKNRMLEVVRSRRVERLEKIVQLAREKRAITNDDVQKLLLVSDSTATRYLNSLVVQVRLRRVGPRGHQYYEPL